MQIPGPSILEILIHQMRGVGPRIQIILMYLGIIKSSLTFTSLTYHVTLCIHIKPLTVCKALLQPSP